MKGKVCAWVKVILKVYKCLWNKQQLLRKKNSKLKSCKRIKAWDEETTAQHNSLANSNILCENKSDFSQVEVEIYTDLS